MDEDGVKELVLDKGGVKMRRPSLSNLPEGEAILPSTAGVPALDWDWDGAEGRSFFLSRSRLLLAATRDLAAVWSCCKIAGLAWSKASPGKAEQVPHNMGCVGGEGGMETTYGGLEIVQIS